MAKSKLKWLLLAALMAVAPFLYSFIQAYWAFALVPIGQFLSVSGKMPWAILIISLNFLGALFLALLLALPLGYVAKERPYLFGALLCLVLRRWGSCFGLSKAKMVQQRFLELSMPLNS